MSRPSRARGLKHIVDAETFHSTAVAPLAGAWIETPIISILTIVLGRISRAPRGRVD